MTTWNELFDEAEVLLEIKTIEPSVRQILANRLARHLNEMRFPALRCTFGVQAGKNVLDQVRVSRDDELTAGPAIHAIEYIRSEGAGRGADVYLNQQFEQKYAYTFKEGKLNIYIDGRLEDDPEADPPFTLPSTKFYATTILKYGNPDLASTSDRLLLAHPSVIAAGILWTICERQDRDKDMIEKYNVAFAKAMADAGMDLSNFIQPLAGVNITNINTTIVDVDSYSRNFNFIERP